MDGRTSISLMPPHISGTKYYYFFFCEEYTEECTVQCVVPSSDPSHRALPFLSYPTLSIFWVRLSSLFAISPHINFENKIFLHQTSFPLHSLSPLLLFSYSLSPSISAPCLSLTLSHTHTHTQICNYVRRACTSSYMLLELLKNSMRATVELHGVENMPPIRIIIADGEDNEDVSTLQ